MYAKFPKKLRFLTPSFQTCKNLFKVSGKDRGTISEVLSQLIVSYDNDNFLISDFKYGFRSSRSTADLLTVVSDSIAKAFNRSGATRGQIFGLISSFLSNRQLRVVLGGQSAQEYPVNAGVPQGSILGPTLFLLYINDLPDDVICNIAIYAGSGISSVATTRIGFRT